MSADRRPSISDICGQLPYFHRNFRSTDEVTEYIKRRTQDPGSYLLRPSNRHHDRMTVSVLVKDHSVRHTHVYMEGSGDQRKFYLVKEQKFNKLEDLINYYKQNPVRNLEGVPDVYFKFPIPHTAITPNTTPVSSREPSVNSLTLGLSSPTITRSSSLTSQPPPVPRRDSSFTLERPPLSPPPNGAIARPPAPLPPTGHIPLNPDDYAKTYSRARDTNVDLSGQLIEQLRDHERCECGISRELGDLPCGWTVHRSKDVPTFGKLFFQSGDGQTSWVLPENVRMQLTRKHLKNLEILKSRSSVEMNATLPRLSSSGEDYRLA
ncbi:hypothetical protein CHS0354_030649 [Potamilus streckersoni]|uniref:SH2 domain-containing protein n=1 Tax=Potamilus streckersoni TaxID=2493646 RepID=A0AAE0SIY4_9BIVA|nr:hypothetical protein CHS0354_030649 [Potamilus streckersoni]